MRNIRIWEDGRAEKGQVKFCGHSAKVLRGRCFFIVGFRGVRG